MARIIKADDFDEPRDGKAAVLKLTDLAEEARVVVLEARREAARIVAEARAGAEALERQGREEGRSAGREEGRQEGLRLGREEAQEETRRLAGEARELLAGLAAEHAQARSQAMRQAARELLELAVELARKVVGRFAATHVSAAQTNLEKVLELAGRQADVTVLVNPAQLELLQSCLNERNAREEFGGKVVLSADETISPGGVRLLSRHGQLDATLETQMENIASALLGERRPQAQMGLYEAVTPEPASARAREANHEAV